MDDQGYFNLTAAVLVTVVVVAGFAALMWEGSSASGATGSSLPTVERNLTIQWDPSASSYVYSSAHLSVPLNTHVVFVITNYDPEAASYIPSPSDARVSGTNGATMTVLRDGASSVATEVPFAQVSHTFTISSGIYDVNVPIPVASSSTDPVQVSFSVDFTTPGTFDWGCVILCGTQDMTAPGDMYGTITVA